ncbi:MAG: glycosyltransferase [Nanoarchaeota archaeon]|nr:glycosyltransferase [Nanoarchaeota archaeon]
MISIIITAYNEPETIGTAIESFLKQNIKHKYELIVSCPDKETTEVVKKYMKKNKNIKHFKDPGQGKMLALNMLFKKAKGKILILTDGDVFVSENSLKAILKSFEDPNVGCLSGRPVSINSKDNMLGYWSHLLTDAGAHRTRMEKAAQKQYFTCSGYLFAFRNNVVKEFPRDIPEDAYIPFLFMEEGYKITYVPEAKVYVKYPTTFKEWVEQKRRIAKAYINYKQIKIDNKPLPLMKSFSKEAIEGPIKAIRYPKNFKEMFWTLTLFGARLYMWLITYYETKIANKQHTDAWKVVKTTKKV